MLIALGQLDGVLLKQRRITGWLLHHQMVLQPQLVAKRLIAVVNQAEQEHSQ